MNPMNNAFRFLLCAWLALVAASPASAQEVAAIDAQAIRKVIEQQLDAFAADDAERAFSHAAPMIRQLFGTPERFLAMVRRGYPVVYRPARVAFLRPEVAEGEIHQAVQMQDADGEVWTATYRMQRQSDKSWRISGVELAPSKSRAI
jgi:hypothetical protein